MLNWRQGDLEEAVPNPGERAGRSEAEQCWWDRSEWQILEAPLKVSDRTRHKFHLKADSNCRKQTR